MQNKIIETIRVAAGVTTDYDAFDDELIMDANIAFMELNDMGVGPAGFSIEDGTEEWSSFSTDRDILNASIGYVGKKVCKLFDPPANQTLMTALDDQIKECGWRAYRAAQKYYDEDSEKDGGDDP